MSVLMMAFNFIVGSIVSLYVYMLVARLFMQKQRLSAINPLVRLVLKATSPVVRPLQRVLPEWRGYDLAILFLLLLIQWVAVEVDLWAKLGQWPAIMGAVVIALARLASLGFMVYYVAIVAVVILSWLPMLPNFLLRDVLTAVAGPPLRWAQRLIPSFSGIDFSPAVLLFGLYLMEILVVGYLWDLGEVLLK